MKTFLRILIIGAILLILVFLSIGIVRVVPKALSSLASATVSLGSFFNGSDNSAKTNTGANTNSTTNSANTTSTNDAGFIVSTSTSANASGSNATTTSYSDLLKNKFGSYGPNSFIPKSGTNMSTYNTYGSASGANPSTSGSAGATISSACVNTGTSDIAVSIISKGIINRTTGQFIETNTFSTNDTVSIKFKVENRGACATGVWNLRVQMPSTNSADQVRDFTNNQSIPGGLAVTGQANFDSPSTINPVFSVTVADNSGKDASSANNTASVALAVVNGTNTGGNNGTGSNGVIVTGDGRADLAVRIVQIGTLGYNNVFIPQSNTSVFRPTDRVAVKFEVINQGKSATGPWTFRAELTDAPNANKQYQNPQSEASIVSGGKATFTIGFDNIRTGNNSITIFTDSMNQVNEFDENNNVGVASFFVSY